MVKSIGNVLPMCLNVYAYMMKDYSHVVVAVWFMIKHIVWFVLIIV